MNEQKNNGRGIFYGVIGVATLVVAIIGATFAYFTATASNNNVINGTMASISFNLSVKKVTTADEEYGGMIPMSNSMVEAALSGKTDAKVGAETDPEKPKICVDDNGNAVCQIYKISVVNGGTAGMFLDGYVSLSGGSGVATDVTAWKNVSDVLNQTTMRWAQVFCKGKDNALTSCTTAGITTTTATKSTSGDTKGITAGGSSNWDPIKLSSTDDSGAANTKGKNTAQIILTGDNRADLSDITTKGTIAGNDYDIINKNYIRISDHAPTATGYTRLSDVTSALVFNQFIAPMTGPSAAVIQDTDDSDEERSDAQVYYIVVWLSETGTNQTAGATGADNNALQNVPTSGSNFFSGNVSFISAQGSEVTATFSGYTAVQSDQVSGGSESGS